MKNKMKEILQSPIDLEQQIKIKPPGMKQEQPTQDANAEGIGQGGGVATGQLPNMGGGVVG